MTHSTSAAHSASTTLRAAVGGDFVAQFRKASRWEGAHAAAVHVVFLHCSDELRQKDNVLVFAGTRPAAIRIAALTVGTSATAALLPAVLEAGRGHLQVQQLRLQREGRLLGEEGQRALVEELLDVRLLSSVLVGVLCAEVVHEV